MQRRIAIKNHVQEIQLITRRALIVFFIMILLIACLILRLAHLQLSKHDLYSTLSNKNSLDLVPLEPTRGLIFDRNGLLLADNVPVFSLDIIPYKVGNLPKMLVELQKIIPLSPTDLAQFRKQLFQHRRFDEIPLKLRLTESEVARFYENQYRFPGAIIKARLMRRYPSANTFSHVLGYVGRINTQELNNIDVTNYSASTHIGKLGIEKFYEDELHGLVGYQQAETDASGEIVRIINQIKPVAGKNLYLTIDSNLQIEAEKALAGHRGAVVIIKPSTGEVLALVSEPAFDPNVFVDGISSQNFKALRDSEDKPLYNRAIRGIYPLASTIKPFIALEGLNSGVVTAEDTIFDPGWYQLKNSDRLFRDWRHHGHGTVNLTRAITVSCDTYFFDLANKLGIHRIDYILDQFGFGKLTGLDVDEELPGIVATPEWKLRTKGQNWYPGDTLNAGIGQGFMQATPLQLAAGVAAISNRGKYFAPYLLYAEQTPGKNINLQPKENPHEITLHDKSDWDTVISAMEDVITSPEGTGRAHFGTVPPYSVAAKTGTAQMFTIKHTPDEAELDDQLDMPEKLRDHSLIIAFAPTEDPQLAIAVIVENAKLASGIARQIFDYYFLKPPALLAKPPMTGNSHATH